MQFGTNIRIRDIVREYNKFSLKLNNGSTLNQIHPDTSSANIKITDYRNKPVGYPNKVPLTGPIHIKDVFKDKSWSIGWLPILDLDVIGSTTWTSGNTNSFGGDAIVTGGDDELGILDKKTKNGLIKTSYNRDVFIEQLKFPHPRYLENSSTYHERKYFLIGSKDVTGYDAISGCSSFVVDKIRYRTNDKADFNDYKVDIKNTKHIYDYHDDGNVSGEAIVYRMDDLSGAKKTHGTTFSSGFYGNSAITSIWLPGFNNYSTGTNTITGYNKLAFENHVWDNLTFGKLSIPLDNMMPGLTTPFVSGKPWLVFNNKLGYPSDSARLTSPDGLLFISGNTKITGNQYNIKYDLNGWAKQYPIGGDSGVTGIVPWRLVLNSPEPKRFVSFDIGCPDITGTTSNSGCWVPIAWKIYGTNTYPGRNTDDKYENLTLANSTSDANDTNIIGYDRIIGSTELTGMRVYKFNEGGVSTITGFNYENFDILHSTNEYVCQVPNAATIMLVGGSSTEVGTGDTIIQDYNNIDATLTVSTVKDLELELDSTKNIVKYRISSYTQHVNAPSSWTLKGSLNGTTDWVEIDNRKNKDSTYWDNGSFGGGTDGTSDKFAYRDFFIANPEYYKYYKFDFKEDVNISKINLFDLKEIPVITQVDGDTRITLSSEIKNINDDDKLIFHKPLPINKLNNNWDVLYNNTDYPFIYQQAGKWGEGFKLNKFDHYSWHIIEILKFGFVDYGNRFGPVGYWMVTGNNDQIGATSTWKEPGTTTTTGLIDFEDYNNFVFGGIRFYERKQGSKIITYDFYGDNWNGKKEEFQQKLYEYGFTYNLPSYSTISGSDKYDSTITLTGFDNPTKYPMIHSHGDSEISIEKDLSSFANGTISLKISNCTTSSILLYDHDNGYYKTLKSLVSPTVSNTSNKTAETYNGLDIYGPYSYRTGDKIKISGTNTVTNIIGLNWIKIKEDNWSSFYNPGGNMGITSTGTHFITSTPSGMSKYPHAEGLAYNTGYYFEIQCSSGSSGFEWDLTKNISMSLSWKDDRESNDILTANINRNYADGMFSTTGNQTEMPIGSVTWLNNDISGVRLTSNIDTNFDYKNPYLFEPIYLDHSEKLDQAGNVWGIEYSNVITGWQNDHGLLGKIYGLTGTNVTSGANAFGAPLIEALVDDYDSADLADFQRSVSGIDEVNHVHVYKANLDLASIAFGSAGVTGVTGGTGEFIGSNLTISGWHGGIVPKVSLKSWKENAFTHLTGIHDITKFGFAFFGGHGETGITTSSTTNVTGWGNWYQVNTNGATTFLYNEKATRRRKIGWEWAAVDTISGWTGETSSAYNYNYANYDRDLIPAIDDSTQITFGSNLFSDTHYQYDITSASTILTEIHVLGDSHVTSIQNSIDSYFDSINSITLTSGWNDFLGALFTVTGINSGTDSVSSSQWYDYSGVTNITWAKDDSTQEWTNASSTALPAFEGTSMVTFVPVPDAGFTGISGPDYNTWISQYNVQYPDTHSMYVSDPTTTMRLPISESTGHKASYGTTYLDYSSVVKVQINTATTFPSWQNHKSGYITDAFMPRDSASVDHGYDDIFSLLAHEAATAYEDGVFTFSPNDAATIQVLVTTNNSTTTGFSEDDLDAIAAGNGYSTVTGGDDIYGPDLISPGDHTWNVTQMVAFDASTLWDRPYNATSLVFSNTAWEFGSNFQVDDAIASNSTTIWFDGDSTVQGAGSNKLTGSPTTTPHNTDYATSLNVVGDGVPLDTDLTSNKQGDLAYAPTYVSFDDVNRDFGSDSVVGILRLAFSTSNHLSGATSLDYYFDQMTENTLSEIMQDVQQSSHEYFNSDSTKSWWFNIDWNDGTNSYDGNINDLRGFGSVESINVQAPVYNTTQDIISAATFYVKNGDQNPSYSLTNAEYDGLDLDPDAASSLSENLTQLDSTSLIPSYFHHSEYESNHKMAGLVAGRVPHKVVDASTTDYFNIVNLYNMGAKNCLGVQYGTSHETPHLDTTTGNTLITHVSKYRWDKLAMNDKGQWSTSKDTVRDYSRADKFVVEGGTGQQEDSTGFQIEASNDITGFETWYVNNLGQDNDAQEMWELYPDGLDSLNDFVVEDTVATFVATTVMTEVDGGTITTTPTNAKVWERNLEATGISTITDLKDSGSEKISIIHNEKKIVRMRVDQYRTRQSVHYPQYHQQHNHQGPTRQRQSRREGFNVVRRGQQQWGAPWGRVRSHQQAQLQIFEGQILHQVDRAPYRTRASATVETQVNNKYYEYNAQDVTDDQNIVAFHQLNLGEKNWYYQDKIEYTKQYDEGDVEIDYDLKPIHASSHIEKLYNLDTTTADQQVIIQDEKCVKIDSITIDKTRATATEGVIGSTELPEIVKFAYIIHSEDHKDGIIHYHNDPDELENTGATTVEGLGSITGGFVPMSSFDYMGGTSVTGINDMLGITTVTHHVGDATTLQGVLAVTGAATGKYYFDEPYEKSILPYVELHIDSILGMNMKPTTFITGIDLVETDLTKDMGYVYTYYDGDTATIGSEYTVHKFVYNYVHNFDNKTLYTFNVPEKEIKCDILMVGGGGSGGYGLYAGGGGGGGVVIAEGITFTSGSYEIRVGAASKDSHIISKVGNNLKFDGTAFTTIIAPAGGEGARFAARGGDEVVEYTTNSGYYRSHTFLRTGMSTLTFYDAATIDYLIVAGGGAGGKSQGSSYWRKGAGGGAGGLIYDEGCPVNAGCTITVTVGAGGLGDDIKTPTSDHEAYANGKNSIIDINDGTTTITAVGGGYGGVIIDGTTKKGGDGGSGGGAKSDGASAGLAGSAEDYLGGTSTISTSNAASINQIGTFGRNGGTTAYQYRGGGGGGASDIGGSGTTANNGGDGKIYDIRNGEPAYYAGGGGGGNYTDVAYGGKGGGGYGGTFSTGIYHTGDFTDHSSGKHGTVNTGGGGGGAWGADNPYSGPCSVGGNGGSGIVVIRYKISTPSNSQGGSGGGGYNSGALAQYNDGTTMVTFSGAHIISGCLTAYGNSGGGKVDGQLLGGGGGGGAGGKGKDGYLDFLYSSGIAAKDKAKVGGGGDGGIGISSKFETGELLYYGGGGAGSGSLYNSSSFRGGLGGGGNSEGEHFIPEIGGEYYDFGEIGRIADDAEDVDVQRDTNVDFDIFKNWCTLNNFIIDDGNTLYYLDYVNYGTSYKPYPKLWLSGNGNEGYIEKTLPDYHGIVEIKYGCSSDDDDDVACIEIGSSGASSNKYLTVDVTREEYKTVSFQFNPGQKLRIREKSTGSMIIYYIKITEAMDIYYDFGEIGRLKKTFANIAETIPGSNSISFVNWCELNGFTHDHLDRIRYNFYSKWPYPTLWKIGTGNEGYIQKILPNYHGTVEVRYGKNDNSTDDVIILLDNIPRATGWSERSYTDPDSGAQETVILPFTPNQVLKIQENGGTVMVLYHIRIKRTVENEKYYYDFGEIGRAVSEEGVEPPSHDELSITASTTHALPFVKWFELNGFTHISSAANTYISYNSMSKWPYPTLWDVGTDAYIEKTLPNYHGIVEVRYGKNDNSTDDVTILLDGVAMNTTSDLDHTVSFVFKPNQVLRVRENGTTLVLYHIKILPKQAVKGQDGKGGGGGGALSSPALKGGSGLVVIRYKTSEVAEKFV